MGFTRWLERKNQKETRSALPRGQTPKPRRRPRPLALEALEDRAVPDAAAPDFVARQDFHAGLDPTQAVVGDFNGDGIPDLAVADRNGVKVSILLGNGDGTFRPPTSFNVPYPPRSLAVGDFNRDGNSDLAVAYTGYDFGGFGHEVAIWLGNGDGTFRLGGTVPTGTAPYFVRAADLTGNGIGDLVVANFISQSVSVARGNGDGTFAPAQSYPVAEVPYSVALGDFNGDGHLDIATANWGTSTNAGHTVSILLGNGDGSFARGPDVFVGLRPHDVAVGDFNGDGHLDLAVALSGTASQSSTAGLAILRGNGDGTFGAPTVYPAGSSDAGVAVGDFTGDGHLDVAVTAWGAYDDNVRLFLGNGDGTFRAGQIASAGHGPYYITAADLNGDGHLDLVTANTFVDTVSVLLGEGTGTFRSAPDYVTGANSRGVVAADFNGDGFPDLAVANNGSGTVSVLLNNGDGTFQPRQDYPVGSHQNPQTLGITVGDFNGDGIPDLATVNENPGEVSILFGNGDGTFEPAQNIPIAGAYTGIKVADLRGNGRSDILVTTSSQVAILLSNGDGTFDAPQYVDAGGLPRSIAVGDFNGDGVPDLAVLDFDPYPHGTVTVLLGNGDGTFRQSAQFEAGGIAASIAAGDFNGDGREDLVVANQLSSTAGDLVFFSGNGDGTFQGPRTLDLGAIPTFVAVADLNGDNIPDLAVATQSNHVAVLAGNGDGTFAPAHLFGVGRYPVSVAVADFNGDGKPDLATANVLGTSDGPFAPTSLGASVLLNDTPFTGGPALPPSKARLGVNQPVAMPLLLSSSLVAGEPMPYQPGNQFGNPPAPQVQAAEAPERPAAQADVPATNAPADPLLSRARMESHPLIPGDWLTANDLRPRDDAATEIGGLAQTGPVG